MLTRIIAVTAHKPGLHSKFVRRLEHVRTSLMPSLRAIGLNPEIFEAVMGSSIVRKDGGQASRSGGEFLHDGKVIKMAHGCIGNFISNYELWKLCVARSEPLLILEDDATLPAENGSFVRDMLAEFRQRPNLNEILYLLGQNPCKEGVMKSYSVSEASPISGALAKIVATGDLSCTAAYCVSPRSAATLMEMVDKIPVRATDGYVHTLQMRGVLDVIVQREPVRGFMLNDNWAEWNHKHNPNV